MADNIPTIGLLQSLRQAQAAAKSPGPRCSVAVVIDRLSADDADDFRSALADDSIRGSTIARHLATLGIGPSEGKYLREDSIQKHRRGTCACGAR